MNGGLHTSPENLRDKLQIEINKHDGLYDDITEIRDALELPCKMIDSNLVLMEKLLNRDWDDDFVVKGPGQKVERGDYD